jgi:hypothetical protein
MKAALAAARAEIEAPDAEPPPGSVENMDGQDAPPPPVRGSDDLPLKLGGDSGGHPEVGDDQPSPTGSEIPTDLDPEISSKLKLLRRLNPDKSYEELLAQAVAHAGDSSSSNQDKKKRKWFSLK